MAITDDPDLNQKINNHRYSNKSKKYCKKCGKVMVYNRTDKRGNVRQYFDWQWINRICEDCFDLSYLKK